MWALLWRLTGGMAAGCGGADGGGQEEERPHGGGSLAARPLHPLHTTSAAHACPLRAKSGLCLVKDRRPASLTCTRSSLAEVIVNRFMQAVSKLPYSAVPPCYGAKLLGLSSGCTRAQSASPPAVLSFWACRLAARVCAAQPGSPSPPTAWPANAASLRSRQARPTLCRTGTASAPRTTLRKSVDAVALDQQGHRISRVGGADPALLAVNVNHSPARVGSGTRRRLAAEPLSVSTTWAHCDQGALRACAPFSPRAALAGADQDGTRGAPRAGALHRGCGTRAVRVAPPERRPTECASRRERARQLPALRPRPAAAPCLCPLPPTDESLSRIRVAGLGLSSRISESLGCACRLSASRPSLSPVPYSRTRTGRVPALASRAALSPRGSRRRNIVIKVSRALARSHAPLDADARPNAARRRGRTIRRARWTTRTATRCTRGARRDTRRRPRASGADARPGGPGEGVLLGAAARRRVCGVAFAAELAGPGPGRAEARHERGAGEGWRASGGDKTGRAWCEGRMWPRVWCERRMRRRVWREGRMQRSRQARMHVWGGQPRHAGPS